VYGTEGEEAARPRGGGEGVPPLQAPPLLRVGRRRAATADGVCNDRRRRRWPGRRKGAAEGGGGRGVRQREGPACGPVRARGPRGGGGRPPGGMIGGGGVPRPRGRVLGRTSATVATPIVPKCRQAVKVWRSTGGWRPGEWLRYCCEIADPLGPSGRCSGGNHLADGIGPPAPWSKGAAAGRWGRCGSGLRGAGAAGGSAGRGHHGGRETDGERRTGRHTCQETFFCIQ